MTRPHDMGGRFGDGPVQPQGQEPVFARDWHARALGLTLAAGALGQWTLDMSRHARERLSPVDYARFSYYEKWLAALADLLVERGIVSTLELTGGPVAASPLAARRLPPDAVPRVLATGGPTARETGLAARFRVGDRVRTLRTAGNRQVDGGHTRLPAYAAGVSGTVVRLHGAHVFPDTNAHDLGEAPEPLYSVAFRADALWTHPENPRDLVMVDIWDSYLEPE